MKKNLLFTCLFLVSTMLFSQGSWLQKSSLPGSGRLAAFAFSIGPKGYIGCGQIASATYASDFWELNEDCSWTQKANFAGGVRYSPSAFTIDSLAYVCLGFDGQCKNDVWSYNPIINTWTQKNNFPGTARYGAFSFSIGNKAYIGMGSINYAPFLTDFWQYNPATDSWMQKVSYNSLVGRLHGVGLSLNNKGYAGLGTDDGSGNYVNDFYEYDPINNSWTQKANFPDSRGGASYFAIDNCAYVGTGVDNNTLYTNSLWKFDPVTNAWTPIASLGLNGRNAAIGFSIGNKGFLGFGATLSGSYLNDIWEYTPAASSIKEITSADMAVIRIDMTNKKILLEMNAMFQCASFKIYNITGQLLSSEKIKNSTQAINISHLSKGCYIFRMDSNGKTKSDKFIIF
ncbi:MAG: T9SS type A sorting domain-containing protein [Bacteroidota bacterium]